jgi:hypothetical protein
MAKRKMSAEEVTTIPPEHVNVQVVVEVPGSQVIPTSLLPTDETVQPDPVSTKMKFRQLGGYHIQGDVKYGPGDIVESDDDLSAIHGSSKFERV